MPSTRKALLSGVLPAITNCPMLQVEYTSLPKLPYPWTVGTRTASALTFLPVLGRNVSALAVLVPTVHGYGNFGSEVYSTWSMGQLVIAGSTPLNNAFLVDGISAEKMTDYGLMSFLPTDATQEF